MSVSGYIIIDIGNFFLHSSVLCTIPPSLLRASLSLSVTLPGTAPKVFLNIGLDYTVTSSLSMPVFCQLPLLYLCHLSSTHCSETSLYVAPMHYSSVLANSRSLRAFVGSQKLRVRVTLRVSCFQCPTFTFTQCSRSVTSPLLNSHSVFKIDQPLISSIGLHDRGD